MNDGGRAFPSLVRWVNDPPDSTDTRGYFGVTEANSGASLVDLYAGMALQGMLTYQEPHGPCTIQDFARAAWDQAEAMIAERERRIKK